MSLLETERFKLPLLATGQAHKELFHNEALARIDFLMHPHVEAIASDPAAITPMTGQAWIVGSDATDVWLGHDDQIAGWTGNGWLFITPLPMMCVSIKSLGSFAIYRDSWQVSGVVESPAAGAVIDTEARAAIDSILTILEAQGILQPGV